MQRAGGAGRATRRGVGREGHRRGVSGADAGRMQGAVAVTLARDGRNLRYVTGCDDAGQRAGRIAACARQSAFWNARVLYAEY